MSRRMLLLVIVLGVLGSACGSSSRDPLSPTAVTTAPVLNAAPSSVISRPPSHLRFPLVLGATWTYEATELFRRRQRPDAEFGPWRTQQFVRTARCTRMSMQEGATYFVVEGDYRRAETPDVRGFGSRQYLREDATALYAFPDLGGLAANMQVGGAAPVPRRQERVVLAYPLHVGARWASGSQDGTTYVVEAIEPVRLSSGVEPAARVRAESIAIVPGRDWDLAWYGRSGVLRYSIRRESALRESVWEEHLIATSGL